MQRTIYSILFHLALPLIGLRLLWRSRKAPAYRKRLGERFGRIRPPAELDPAQPLIWLHAVSVGETVAAAPLVTALRGEFPGFQFLITTMTPTGAEQVRRQFGASVIHHYAPYDAGWIVRRFLAAFRPRLLILMETELWPNMLREARRGGVPAVLANGRLSEKSWRSYSRFRPLARAMLGDLRLVCAQSEADAGRFRDLGAEPVRVTGSLKFALRDDAPQPLAVIERWKAGRGLIVAGSTREGEEAKVLQAFKDCLAEFPQTLLLIVPRHPERFEAVFALCAAAGFATARRGDSASFAADTQIAVGDSMGEMMAYFASADIAFVGGSLVDTGCHNVLEPAALGLPVTIGPSRFNFAAVCELLEEAGALRCAGDSGELGGIWRDLLADPARRARMGAAGKAVVAANQQALELTLAEIRKSLEPVCPDNRG